MAHVYKHSQGSNGIPRRSGIRRYGRGSGGGGVVDSADFTPDIVMTTSGQLGIAPDAIVAGGEGTCSFFYRFAAANVGTGEIISNSGSRLGCGYSADEKVEIIGRRSPDGVIVLRLFSLVDTKDTVWHHAVASWDLDTGRAYLYLDDVDQTDVNTLLVGEDIDYNRSQWAIGGNVNTFNRVNGHLAELYFHDKYIDLTQEPVRRMFLRADGRPAFNDNGRAVFGEIPWVHVSGTARDWQTNQGRGDDFDGFAIGSITDLDGNNVPFPEVGS